MAGGRVYWITGLSNSGKTTVGTALYYTLKREMPNVILLDGDLLQEIASGTEVASFDKKDRLIRAKRYAKIAKLLSDQGAWVIVCALAMFDEIREWNRKNVKGYIEIFLDVPNNILKKRDKKNLYREFHDVQLPKFPDIVIHNDGMQSIHEMVGKIRELTPQKEDDFGRDRAYWNQYYEAIVSQEKRPSNFAVEVVSHLQAGAQILELGCGDGRDSLYFLRNGFRVTAVDASDVAIDNLNRITADDKNALFVCDDFVKCQSLYQMRYDCIYSRFTLHAITEEQENELLLNARGALASGGFFYIEARTIHDEIFGKGRKIDHNTYIYDGHFRRFIDVSDFSNKIRQMGFKIKSIEEAKGFSKTQQSDPILMRCVACI